MALNCRQGDRALVIRGRDAGKVIACLELLPAGFGNVDWSQGPLWRVDRPLSYHNEDLGGVEATAYLAPDRILLPIGSSGHGLNAAEVLEAEASHGR